MLSGIVILLLFFLALFIEGTFLSLPLVIVVVIIASTMLSVRPLVVIAFFTGLFFDMLTFDRVGLTSIFLVCVVVLISLYDRKFEIRSLPFIFFVSSIAVSFYLLIFGSYAFFVQLITGVLLSAVLFMIIKTSNLLYKKERQ